MATMTTINVRTSAETKKAAEELFEDFGLSMTSAINVFLKQVIRERRIPFEIYEGKKEVTREGALAAFDAIRAKAIKDGVADMSLAEINAEITKTRNGE